jgi:hypothetical protein
LQPIFEKGFDEMTEGQYLMHLIKTQTKLAFWMKENIPEGFAVFKLPHI